MAVIPFVGFVGGSYEHRHSVVDAEKCVNWIPEMVPAEANQKARIVYVCRPGLESFATAGTGRRRAEIEQNGRSFVVTGSDWYELYSTGVTLLRGTAGQLGDDGKPASAAHNGPQGGQIAIASNGNGFIYDLTANTLTQITDPQFPSHVTRVDFWRGHFVWIAENGVSFYLSNQYGGTAYDAADIGEKSFTSDYIVSHLVDDNGEAWVFGTKKTEVWHYTGAAGFPAEPVNVVIASGAAAPHAACLVGGSPYLLASNRTVVRHRSGYQPERISHHALEATLESYTEGQIAKSEAVAFDWNGHRFFVLTIADVATWVFDETTSLWHQWDLWVSAQSKSEAFLGLGYLKVGDKHLMGSRKDGTIYQFTPTALTDGGMSIRTVRRSPYVFAYGLGVLHHAIAFDFQAGVGTGSGQGENPIGLVRWSDDQAKTWSNEQEITLGKQGQYDHDAVLRRLGLASKKGRIYELVITDPVVRALTGAFLHIGTAA